MSVVEVEIVNTSGVEIVAHSFYAVQTCFFVFVYFSLFFEYFFYISTYRLNFGMPHMFPLFLATRKYP